MKIRWQRKKKVRESSSTQDERKKEKVLIEEKLLEFEKDKPKVLIKTNTINEGGKAFHEKKDKNKKINLGGPGKRKPPKQTGNRAQKKKKNG